MSEDSLAKLCIVRWWKDNWYYISTERKGKQLYAKVRALGDFALMWDFEPPSIEYLSANKDTVFMKFGDNLSGIGENNLPQAEIDGDWVLLEFDYEDGELMALPRKSLGKGRHRFLIRTSDRAGNTTEKQFDFSIE